MLFSLAHHRRLKTPTGWVVRLYQRHGTIVVYREGLLDSHPVDELLLTYASKNPRRDFKRIRAALWANVIDPTGGALEPRPDPELLSAAELEEEGRRRRSFWIDVRRQEQVLQQKRLSGGL